MLMQRNIEKMHCKTIRVTLVFIFMIYNTGILHANVELIEPLLK